MPGYSIGFQTLNSEIDVPRLPVTGEVPDWLAGTLLRNGPALYDVPDPSGRPKTFRHWFDGLAMVHRFTIDGGKVSYRNRFLRTEEYRSVRDQGRIGYAEFATDPCGSIFNRLFARWTGRVTDNACVNITSVGDRTVALSETPMPVEFDPQTLATVGLVDFGDGHGRGGPTSAHPHVEPRTGAMVNYSLSFSRDSVYRIYRVRDEKYAREQIARYGIDKPGYIHSFAITENHAVLAVYPFVVNPLSFLLRNRVFIENFQWEPQLGTRIVVFDLAGGQVRGEYRTDAFFAIHHINAFEHDGELIMDLCAYDDAEIIRATYLDRLRGTAPVPLPCPVRYRIDLAAGTVDAQPHHRRAVRAAQDQLRPAQRPPLPLRLRRRLRRPQRHQLPRPARQARHRHRRDPHLARGRLLPGRTRLRRQPHLAEPSRGRRSRPLGGPQRPVPRLVAAGPGRRHLDRTRPRHHPPPHPLRLPRPLPTPRRLPHPLTRVVRFGTHVIRFGTHVARFGTHVLRRPGAPEGLPAGAASVGV